MEHQMQKKMLLLLVKIFFIIECFETKAVFMKHSSSHYYLVHKLSDARSHWLH